MCSSCSKIFPLVVASSKKNLPVPKSVGMKSVFRFTALTLVAGFLLLPVTESKKVATVYDIFALIYRLCAAESNRRLEGLQCVDYHIGAEVSEVIEKCMSEHLKTNEENNNKIKETREKVAKVQGDGVQMLCDKLTFVQKWTTKHTRPPNQLTTVIGIEAFGRMTCVLGNVPRPLTTWTAAFSKCFPNEVTTLLDEKPSGKHSSSANL